MTVAAMALLHGADEAETELLAAKASTQAAARIPPIIYLYVLLAALGNALFGLEQSVIAQAKTDFCNEFSIPTTDARYSFLASANPVGATVGSLLAGVLQDRIGRRFSLILSCCIYIGATFISFFATGFAMLAVGRLQTGLAIGIFSSTVPMYIAELSPPSIRGKFVTVNQISICTGILLGFVVDKLLTPKWRYMFLAGTPLACALLLAFIFVTPFSPRWLASKGRDAEARKVLLTLRGDEATAEAELADIVATVEAGRSSSAWESMRQPWVMRAVGVGVALAFIQQWSGVNTVNSYAPDVLKKAGFNAADALTQSIYIGVVKLVMVIVALGLMDRLGRRDLLMWGTAGMTLSLAVLGTALTLPSAPPLMSAGSLFLYMGFFEISLGPVMWLLLSELYPTKCRGLAMSVGSTACWVFTTMVVFTFTPLTNALGFAGTFFLFAAVCGVALVWMYFYVPETRGKSLEEIEDMLKHGRIR